MNSTVGDDMLPYAASTSRVGAICSSVRPSDSSRAATILSPPGWMAQCWMSPRDRPFRSSNSSIKGGTTARTTLGSCTDSLLWSFPCL